MNDWFGTIAALDRRLRTCVGGFEIGVAPAVAERALNRAPRIRESAFVSFSAVTVPELEKVVALDELPDDARAELSELMARTSGHDLLWLPAT